MKATYQRHLELAAWIETYGRAWQTGDHDLMASLFTENADYRSSPFREPFRGRDEIRAYARRNAGTQRGKHVQMGHPFVDGSRVAVEWWTTMIDEGETVTLPGCPTPPLRARRPLQRPTRVLAPRTGDARTVPRLGRLEEDALRREGTGPGERQVLGLLVLAFVDPVVARPPRYMMFRARIRKNERGRSGRQRPSGIPWAWQRSRSPRRSGARS